MSRCCRPLWLVLLLLFGAVASLSAKTPVDAAIADGILLLGNGSEPKGLDPQIVTGVPENKILTALLEGLVSYSDNPANDPAPGMAERWEHDDDWRVWTFYLRQTQWSNGDPFLASDFVRSYERMLNPRLGAQYADMLYVIEGAEAYHKGETKDFTTVGVKALEERVLQITLRGPTPFFLSMLTHYSFWPINPRVVEAEGQRLGLAEPMYDRANRWASERTFVGNGPFIIEDWRPKQFIRVKRNPLYWDAANVRLNGIIFFAIEEAATEERAFAAGNLHYCNTLPPDLIRVYLRTRPDLIRIEPYLGTYFYRVNVTRPPLDNPKVRRALALAIDTRRITERITQGGQIPTYGFTPDGMNGYATPRFVEYNPEEARRLLAEAGFPGGAGFPKKTLIFNTLDAHRRIAEAVQDMWRAELGIDIALENQEWKTYLENQESLNYELCRAAWIGDYLDPVTFLSMWITGGGNNNTGWSNAEFDRLIFESGQIKDPEARFAALRRAEEILLTDLPILPVYWYVRIYLMDPRVTGWTVHPLDNRNYKYIHFAEPQRVAQLP